MDHVDSSFAVFGSSHEERGRGLSPLPLSVEAEREGERASLPLSLHDRAVLYLAWEAHRDA
jgi:hypothetical protein